MTVKSESEIEKSMQDRLVSISPQLRSDANNGPFYYLSIKAVAPELADASVNVERAAQLASLQFPSVATDAEVAGVARAFGQAVGVGGFSRGTAYVYTSRRPGGTETFNIFEGDLFSTAESGGQVFSALEARSLTAANADAYYNPDTRRYEVPVQVQAVAAGTAGDIAATNLRVILSASSDFEGVTNYTAFTDGDAPATNRTQYYRARSRLGGLDNFSRGGMASIIQEVDPSRITAVALTYSSEYPNLFFRLPDGQAVDAWLLSSPQSTLVTESFVATGGQTDFYLNNAPVLSLSNVFVNGAPVTGDLILDESNTVGRSTQERSYVAIPATVGGDLVDITYTYDSLMVLVQQTLDGVLDDPDTGSLFAADVLVRYSRIEPVVVDVEGTVLGTYDPTTVENEVLTVVGDYLTNGLTDSPVLGGVRSPADLRDQIRAQVPGVANLRINTFCRKSVSPLVETIDIPRYKQAGFEVSSDVTIKFT